VSKSEKILVVSDYEDFRDNIATSGVFEMMDCTVQVWCPEDSDVDQVDRIIRLVESMVNVIDVQIGSRIEDLTVNTYSVVLTQVETDIRKKSQR
jgi:hypothetical protein